ncbi:nuclear factor 7, ovary-like isoform X2 [Dermochelys coriacea]|uniref:nuclear factor 7, ovary-like isoform X2 n=1 Tax=Dermochelys coriacea TaxID=27794 RepID=UPI0018E80AC5|nr:nuclear factor 7, ovary-like isoform X2 [Dermochelys coriacea]
MASSAPQLGSLSEEFSCPVCLDWLQDPVTLPCGHVYCQGCIETTWGTLGVPPACPQCREPCPDRRYAPCRLLRQLIDQARGLSPGGAEEGARPGGRCPEHSEPWEVAGGEFAAREPATYENLRFLPIHQATEQHQEELPSAIAHLESSLARLLTLKTEEEERIRNHQATVLSMEDHISTEFRTLRGWLTAREGEWQERLQRAGSAQLRAMQTKLQELAGKCQAAQEMLTKAQAHLPQQNATEFLTDIKSFLDWAKQQPATPCGPNTGSLSQTLGQFKGPIQYTAWKDMKSILNIDLPRVTLDPATAHPCLVLSEDRTRVRDGHLRRPLPDTPARFDFCVAVLGAEAFTSGRRYWEVELGEKPAWTLGVVHASISRKGKIHASPSKGFWVIRLRGGTELMAKDTPPMVLHPQALPHRIGVYLDYEGGQISFYDARRMSHLYTFSAQFAESVYPYFCPGLYDSAGNATPLKICPLP